MIVQLFLSSVVAVGANNCEMRHRWSCCFITPLLLINTSIQFVAGVDPISVKEWAQSLSSHLHNQHETATKYKEIVKIYNRLADAEVFDPQAELKWAKRQIETYLRDRAKMAWDAKISLESRELRNISEENLNDPLSKDFVRYFDAKLETDEATVFADGHLGEILHVNSSRTYDLKPNVNFYGIETSSEASAVHVPTPVYKRGPHILSRIDWSNIDQIYRRNRERMKDLSFQKFCSESAFMRYFPAAPWRFDTPGLDLFDCRSTEWFIDAATMSKNVLIMLDLSGSMLGQRFEIAKQTIEAILDTLYDNDFFNVMAFSKNAQFLDDCASDGLIQATMRNKKLIWSRLANVSSEGKAEYEKALAKAFTTLMNLPLNNLQWKTKEELTQEREKEELDPDMEYIQLSENVLVVPKTYMAAIGNFTGNRGKMGCNDMIMLITDGAPGFFKDIFALYNKRKTVRFFSFLVGEEATDFEQVRWMACANRGFMVHISNLADIQEKVQHYVRVLSRLISNHAQNINQESAVWSSIARERMSKQFVISVGYPVSLDGTFMGVSAVSIPLIELSQIAHPSLIGSQSYYFMLDNNGYSMFHPQLDQIDDVTKEVKPSFNNLDFSEIEVSAPLTPKPKPGFINCDDSSTRQLTILFSIENIRRVYLQKNTYYSECVDGTQFTLGLAVSEGDEIRLRRKEMFEWSRVDLGWFQGRNWRIHPQWRYCLLNDSDTELTPEAAFMVYAKQMREYGELPLLCRARRRLVDRLLLDLQATSTFDSLWDSEWIKNRQNGVHLTFFATPSGLIRFMNQSLEELGYEEPEDSSGSQTNGYKHFVLEQNRNSVEDEYFKRAVRQKGKLIVDLNRESHLWYTNQEETSYGNVENVTLLAIAYKAIYANDALLGVAGIEFTYDHLVEQMKKFGCKPNSNETRCYLIDEHAYIVYSSQQDVFYSDTLQNTTTKPKVLGTFFGHLNRVAEWTMEVLLKKGFYTETTYWDNQAMCEQQAPVLAFSYGLKPFREFIGLISWLITQFLRFISEFSLISSSAFLASSTPKTEAFTTTFHPTVGRLPCRTKSKFYLANTERKGTASAALLEENYAERPCKQNAAQCAVKVYASWVEGTNLLMIVVKQQGVRSSCYDEKHCPLMTPRALPFGFVRLTPAEQRAREQTRSVNEMGDDEEEGPLSQCPSTATRQRKNVVHCLREQQEEDDEELPCSLTSKTTQANVFVLSFLLALRVL
ncbi:Cache domain-containing protein [Aphelenchoides besseyi]|nr:Cache domain-containing protein [Aphelenchoides besseyi]